MPKKNKSPKVIYRSLSREKAWGQATHDNRSPLIEVDPSLGIGSKRMLEVLIHEASHLIQPELPEGRIDAIGKYICNVLWKENYRRVWLDRKFDKKTKPPKIS
jgi:hypothetical protein